MDFSEEKYLLLETIKEQKKAIEVLQFKNDEQSIKLKLKEEKVIELEADLKDYNQLKVEHESLQAKNAELLKANEKLTAGMEELKKDHADAMALLAKSNEELVKGKLKELTVAEAKEALEKAEKLESNKMVIVIVEKMNAHKHREITYSELEAILGRKPEDREQIGTLKLRRVRMTMDYVVE